MTFWELLVILVFVSIFLMFANTERTGRIGLKVGTGFRNLFADKPVVNIVPEANSLSLKKRSLYAIYVHPKMASSGKVKMHISNFPQDAEIIYSVFSDTFYIRWQPMEDYRDVWHCEFSDGDNKDVQNIEVTVG